MVTAGVQVAAMQNTANLSSYQEGQARCAASKHLAVGPLLRLPGGCSRAEQMRPQRQKEPLHRQHWFCWLPRKRWQPATVQSPPPPVKRNAQVQAGLDGADPSFGVARAN